MLELLATKAASGKKIAELAKELGTDEETLKKDLGELLDQLPGVETLAGLTMICYLAAKADPQQPATPPQGAITTLAPQPDASLKDLPHLQPRELDIMRLIARGLHNEEINTELGLNNVESVKGPVRQLLRKFMAKGRSRLALIYVRCYQPAEEREAWRKEVTFPWPERNHRACELLELVLSWEHCDAPNAALGRLMKVSEHTIKTHWRLLAKILTGFPGNRQGISVAAELHRPK
ncbi:MAG TPA: helix-turn-helix transcriptional regulator [Magnetospirillaceae bacterium]|nr:helix-turn-helix transcriptional regulator [Magnetospirillaceae bacterium]